jgi:pimeloyl-ACP methyl ester carboxylesterase
LYLYYEVTGRGDPLVLVHGSWGDHNSWQSVVPGLEDSFQVLTYDRRGHSQSDDSPGQGYRLQDEEDLAALMTALDLAPAHVVGNSSGASIALGLAARRPELMLSLMAHEPALMGIVAGDAELRPLIQDLDQKISGVLAHLEAGDMSGGTRRFVEEVAYGPGTWDRLPEETRKTFINNAPTFLDEQRDPRWGHLDLSKLSTFSRPILLTYGGQSPPWFPKIIKKLAGAVDHAEQVTLSGAGHAPHRTHPSLYVRPLKRFVAQL